MRKPEPLSLQIGDTVNALTYGQLSASWHGCFAFSSSDVYTEKPNTQSGLSVRSDSQSFNKDYNLDTDVSASFGLFSASNSFGYSLNEAMNSQNIVFDATVSSSTAKHALGGIILTEMGKKKLNDILEKYKNLDFNDQSQVDAVAAASIHEFTQTCGTGIVDTTYPGASVHSMFTLSTTDKSNKSSWSEKFEAGYSTFANVSTAMKETVATHGVNFNMTSKVMIDGVESATAASFLTHIQETAARCTVNPDGSLTDDCEKTRIELFRNKSDIEQLIGGAKNGVKLPNITYFDQMVTQAAAKLSSDESKENKFLLSMGKVYGNSRKVYNDFIATGNKYFIAHEIVNTLDELVTANPNLNIS